MKLTFASTDDYYIEVDSLGNHTLTEQRVSDKGNEYIKVIGHYTSVRQAVSKLAQLKALEKAETMDVMDYLNYLEEEFRKLVNEV